MSKYHKILGVDENANKDEIKNAFRQLAKKYHPDRNSDADAQEKFVEISEAYNILTGKQRPEHSRADYETAARNRAKAYAQMRYKKFMAESKLYDSIPMHKILWPRWVNYFILAFALVFIIDDLLPASEISGKATATKSSYKIENIYFKPVDQHQNIDLNEKTISIKYTPWFHLAKSYKLVNYKPNTYVKPFHSADIVSAFLWIIIILTIAVLANKTKKFENKLLIKTCILILSAGYLFITLSLLLPKIF